MIKFKGLPNPLEILEYTVVEESGEYKHAYLVKKSETSFCLYMKKFNAKIWYKGWDREFSSLDNTKATFVNNHTIQFIVPWASCKGVPVLPGLQAFEDDHGNVL